MRLKVPTTMRTTIAVQQDNGSTLAFLADAGDQTRLLRLTPARHPARQSAPHSCRTTSSSPLPRGQVQPSGE